MIRKRGFESANPKRVSRQCEKFLIGQSRKLPLTVENWKYGTNRDEPGGTRLAGVAEESARRGPSAVQIKLLTAEAGRG